MKSTKFISFEGGEGAGKSIQTQILADTLEKKGISVVKTREPGGSIEAELIRQLLVTGGTKKWLPKSEVLLHYAARIQHVVEVIRPSLANGKWVISDRFHDSTIAYQGYGHNQNLNELELIHSFALKEFKPDFTIVLDLPVEIGLSRSKARRSNEDRYERMDLNFHQRVREGFLKISAQDPERFTVLNASQTIENISNQIFEIISKKFQLNCNI